MKEQFGRVVVWFSAGAASAVALKLAKQKYGNRVVAVYCDTGGEHPDNMRFLKDVERWVGIKVHIIKNEKYSDHFDVARKVKYIRGHAGAPCTVKLKKEPARGFERLGEDLQIYGYTYDKPDMRRAEKYRKNNPERDLEWILIERQVSKADCLGILWKAGIKIPVMYEQGYEHNNCIGCLKASGMGYWNKIRNDYPDHFKQMMELEKLTGFAVCRNGSGEPLFLRDLEPGMGDHATEPAIECSLGCGMVYEEIETA